MTRKTFALCYTVAGICFAISGAAGFVAGRTGYALIRLVLGGAMIFLAVMNYRMYKQQPADPSAGEEPETQPDDEQE